MKQLLMYLLFLITLIIVNPVLAEHNYPGELDQPTKSTSLGVEALGKIKAPEAIANLGFGAIGISRVLSNIIQIIYIVASIVFVFMIVISAFQWIVSGGDKEKLSQAKSRLTNAIIGIFLLGIVFVIIRVVGQLTGFEFFSGQNNLLPTVVQPSESVPGSEGREGDPLRPQ